MTNSSRRDNTTTLLGDRIHPALSALGFSVVLGGILSCFPCPPQEFKTTSRQITQGMSPEGNARAPQRLNPLPSHKL